MSVGDLTDNEILEHLKKNTIFRNNQLSVLVKLLNSINKSSTLAIDGAWGSGKTVFVKQLLMLADEHVNDYGNNTLDKPAIETLRKNQKTFYFNAWENDYLADALSAILLKLIADDDPSLNLESIKRGLSMINPGAALKKATFDLYDPNGKPNKDKLIEDIKTLVNRHGAVNDFIDAIKGDKQRLIFIIDELDRCKPSFAVDLLEVMKHYFVRKDVTFIVATNTSELSHTIKKYYGNDFNSSGYLNKFFDFTYGLSKIDVERYARDAVNWEFDGGMINGLVLDTIDYYKFQMREINAYISALRLIESYTTTNSMYSGNHEANAAVRYLFVPLALALKIKNGNDFTEFVNGTAKGKRLLRTFAESSSEIKDFTKRISIADVGLDRDSSEIEKLQIDSFVELYGDMFKKSSRDNRIAEYLPSFLEVTSLLGSYTIIPDEGEDV